MSHPHAIERVVRRLESRTPLEEDDRKALRALPISCRTLDAASYLVREGEKPQSCGFLLSGFAFRHKVTGEGDRQIISIHMAGEFLDLQNSLLEVADHNIQALTGIEVASIPFAALQALASRRPRIARAMWVDTLVDAAILREWIVNIGRRDSISRISHLMCELALRLRDAGLPEEEGGFYMPMTQEQIADAVGLTPVHVNRVLKELRRRGLIGREKRKVTIVDWNAMRQIGDFSSRYLHLESADPTKIASAA